MTCCMLIFMNVFGYVTLHTPFIHRTASTGFSIVGMCKLLCVITIWCWWALLLDINLAMKHYIYSVIREYQMFQVYRCLHLFFCILWGIPCYTIQRHCLNYLNIKDFIKIMMLIIIYISKALKLSKYSKALNKIIFDKNIKMIKQ